MAPWCDENNKNYVVFMENVILNIEVSLGVLVLRGCFSFGMFPVLFLLYIQAQVVEEVFLFDMKTKTNILPK